MGSLFTLKGFSQEAYLKYTINETSYSYKGNQALGSKRAGDKSDEDKADFQLVSGYLDFTVNTPEKLSFKIRIEKGKKLQVGKYIYQDLLSQTKILPNVCLTVERETADGLIFYNTNGPENGVFAITKVTGDWIEGTFEANVPNDLEEGAPAIKVTKGSFKLRVKEYKW
ncbi:MAG: hypothetical protein EOO20_16160 [Chryseobacterium sp.]|nr:MAG: hypothetical protein EOO20_16160 [Chryseobacterium sp.]